MASKRFDNVQLFVTHSTDSKITGRQDLATGENLAVALAKIKNWKPGLVPTGGSSGQILEWNSSGTAKWTNKDYKVKQTHSTDTDFHPLVLGAPHSASTWSSAISETTDQVYMNKGIYVKPSTSTIYTAGLYADGYLRTDITGQTLNLNTITLSEGNTHIKRYIERTDGGSNNISNMPITGKPFLLEVELIRWASGSDYITRQLFTNANNPANQYVRYCTNGTWGAWTTRVFTDTKVTSVGNHYAPAGDDSAIISKDASSLTPATWGTTSLVTGVDVKRDAKGHVVDIELDSIQIPANPVPSNNVTGSGTSGYLTKWNGTNTITNGPQLGSDTTLFLRNDGSWATPPNTLYSAGTGLTLNGTTFDHTNSITAQTDSFVFKKIKYDAQGHITDVDDVTASDLPSHTHLYAGSASAGGPATQIATTVTNGTTTLTRYGIVFVADPAVSEGNAARKNNDFRVNFLNGTTSSAGYTELVLGNNKTSTTADNKYGMLTLYSPGANLGFFKTDTLSENRTYTFPNKTGTVALTSDIVTYSAGTGLSLSGTTFNHSNSITAETSFVFKKIKYDAQGHITAVTAVEAGDLPSHTHPYLPDTTLYAGSSTQGGPATYVALPRVTADAKSFPGTNKVEFKEYSNTSTNTPSSAWYHIISMQGSDNKYGTQLALGMTTAGVYYRNYNSQTWSSWQPMGRFTITPTTGQVVITDGTTGGIKSSGYTIAKSVPSDAVFTDSNVLQSAAPVADADYRPIIMGYKNSTDPTVLADTVTGQVYTSTKVFIQPASGNINLFSVDGSDTPGILFRRGTLLDATLDWKIYNSAGLMTFVRTVEGQSLVWETMVQFKGDGVYFKGTKVSMEGHYHTQIKATSTTGSTSLTNYAPVFVNNPTTSNTETVYKTNDVRFQVINGTASAEGSVALILGNNKTSTTADNKRGMLDLYDSGSYYAQLATNTLTANRFIKLPNKDGTIALTEDLEFIPLKTGGGIATVSGEGQNIYYQLATIKITANYVNRPLVFEMSGRGHNFTRLEVMFKSASNTDPELQYFISDGYRGYYIKKTTTSTWVIYGSYTESWGTEVLHRITGHGYGNLSLTIDMTNYGTTAPTDTTQVSYGWYSAAANKWVTARTLTIGSTGKNVDGSGNVSWSLAEIGAAASNHNHDDKYLKLSGGTITSSDWIAFKIKRTGTQSAGVHFENNNGYLGAVAMNTVDGPLMRWKTDGQTGYVVYDEGNTTTTSIGSASAGTAISADDITAWSAGTAASLTTTTHTVPNVTGNTSVSIPNVTGNTSVSIPNVSSVSSVSIPNVTGNTSVSIPNVTGNTDVSIPNVTGNTSVTVKSVKTANTPTTCKIQSGVLTFTKGTAVATEDKTATNTTLGTALTASKVTLGTALSASKVTLGTALSASKVTMGDDLTATNTTLGTALSASKVTLGTAFSIKGVNAWTTNTLPSLTYTARSIPNISVTTVSNVLQKVTS